MPGRSYRASAAANANQGTYLTDFEEACASERKIPTVLGSEALALGAASAWVSIFRCMGWVWPSPLV